MECSTSISPSNSMIMGRCGIHKIVAPNPTCLKLRPNSGRHQLQCRAKLGHAQTGTTPSRSAEAIEAVASRLASAVQLEPLKEASALPHSEGEAAHARWEESSVRRGLASGVAGLLMSAAVSLSPLPALATDTVAVGTCLLANCQVELAKCVGDFECLENLVCLQTCTNRPDETACQIKCGDRYADKAVEVFNACAVSNRKCVPQRVDKDVFPVPPDCSLEANFDLSNFQGRWYITAGLNPLFDTFDCQEHFFGVPDPGQLYAKINWRIDKGDTDFIERSTIQTFYQDETKPAVLYNHGNEYLHYEDDWYILAQKPDEYVVVYYKGNNDAWQGYGGAVVYTRAASLPQQFVPEISAAVEKAGMKWADFEQTDNSCKPHPPPKSIIEKVEKGAEEELQSLERFVAKEAREIENTIETDLRSFGKGFTVLEQDLLQVLQKPGQGITSEISRDAARVEKELEDKARSFLEGIESRYQPPILRFPNPFAGFRWPGSS